MGVPAVVDVKPSSPKFNIFNKALFANHIAML